MPTSFKNQSSSLKEIKSYTPPKLYTGKEWYVGFKAFDPSINDMRRKKIKVNFIERIGDRRKYADGLIIRLNSKLERGWNPWVETENGKAYHTFTDVCTHYKRFISKMLADNEYREETYISYNSYIVNVERWNASRKNKITYIYQFNAEFIEDFIEHIHIERDNSMQTRNNYLRFIRMFCSWLVQHRYAKEKASDGFMMICKNKIKKQRTIISEKDMDKLKEHVGNTNRYYLLACYILHYCFIRPKEMSLLKLENFSLVNQTVFIGEDVSKNKKNGTVTLPAKVIHLMVELKIFDNPGSWHLFSTKFKPGKEYHSEKQFRDYWSTYVRKPLKFASTYKFYSLKDTGITNMLRKYDSITVRDQARHADILMTDTYTPHDLQQANDLIKNHDGNF